MLKVSTDGASRMRLRALGLVTAIAATTALAGTVSVAQAGPPGASASQAGTASIDPAVQAALNRGETPAVPLSLTVTGGGGGANGIVLSGPLDHAVADNPLGTTLNVVTSAFDDSGPISGDWDFNFYDIGGFSFYTIDTYETQYVVDGTGDVVVMHVGDVVGPASTFSSNAGTGPVPTASEWLSGTDGYAGVRFHCDGRLPNPVAGGICYGFVHITTTSGNGFPATLADTGFDGDGNPMTIVGGAAGSDPSATVTPSSLSMTVAANATATEPLNIANAAGSDALTYSIAARGTNKPKLIPHTGLSKMRGMERNPDIGKLVQLDRLRNRPAPRLTAHHASHAATPWAAVGPDGSQTVFQVDDGSYEQVIGLNNAGGGGNESFGAVWVNQFSATEALTIDSISIEWPSTSGVTIGMQPNLLVYYDAASSGDLTQAVRLGTDTIVTIGSLDAFETYTTNFSVPGAGDVYIGFDDAWALVDGGFEGIVSPAAIDENSSPGAAWISGQSAAGVLTDLNNLANNDLTGTAAGFGFAGNWLVRATGTGGGGGGPCTGPIVNWLSAAPATGSVNGGADADVTITANPTAGGLAAGTYSGEVCITTNDPAHTLISVPVSLTVTAVVGQGCNAADSIFCDGFDGKPTGGDVVSGTINQPVAQDGDGSSFDFALEDYHPYNPSISADDINLYYLESGGADGGPPGMYAYWYGDAVPPEFSALVGGVVDSGGVDFAVLHSGDTVGPSSTLSAASISMINWIGGADGYIGVAFYNEGTSAVNYGYIHVTTTGPQGFPAQALEWAYDSSGAAITIPLARSRFSSLWGLRSEALFFAFRPRDVAIGPPRPFLAMTDALSWLGERDASANPSSW